MSLQFILGKASDDHFSKVVDNLRKTSDNPATKSFYIVPNNVKFESELNTLKKLNVKNEATYAQNQVQVFSFSRLIWYFLNGEADYQLPQLSQTAINMIIYQIIEDHEEKLTIYRGEGKQAGFIQQIANQISELQQGNLSPDDLDQLADLDANQINPELRSKLHDISLIYREFVQQTDGKYTYNGANFELLREYLAKLPDQEISTMHFYFSNFEKFSAQQLQIIQLLIARAHVVIDLNLDRKYDQTGPDENKFFYQSGKIYHYFYQYARKIGAQIYMDQTAAKREINPGFHQLEDYWITSNEVGRSIPAKESQNEAIEILKTNNAFEELSQIAIKIRQLVATGKYRYRDFLIVTRNLSQYQNIINPIFTMQQIPYFTDIQKHMDNHPLVELIDALFSIYRPNRAQNYAYDDVMRLLKTELLIPKDAADHYLKTDEYRQDLALCENLVLKNGYNGSRWTQSADWMSVTFRNSDNDLIDKDVETSAKINVIRHFIKDILPPFYRKMNKAKNGREAALILYQFLIKNGVATQLKNWQNQATEAGNLEEAGQAEQVWNQFCSILDDYVTVLGDHEFVMDDFLELLKAGFVGASYSQIPSTLDQVAISETGRIQLPDKKITFVMGADDLNMPAKIDNHNLLNDSDRDQMDDFLADDQYMVDTSELQMVSEPYEDYLVFMTPSDKLYFSYNLGGNGEEGLRQISPYVERLQNQFALPVQQFKSLPAADSNQIDRFLGSDRTTLNYLVQASLNAKKTNQPLSAAWKTVQHQLENNPNREIRDLTKNLLGSLHYKNQPVDLAPNRVIELYGNQIVTSISKLEEFYTDPYEYFLKYGLRLREREEFEISPANTGQFYHEALDKFIQEVQQQKLDLAEMNQQDVHQLVEEVTRKIIEADDNYQYEILKSSQRMSYITNQLIATVQQMAETLRHQFHWSKFRPKQTEIAFGPGKKFNPLSFDLPDNKQVNVQGRIDRLDTIKVDGVEYLGVVDYKSGDKTIDMSQIYDGTAMQMMTYMDAVLKNINLLADADDAKLAGALYMHIFDPILKPGEVKNWEEPVQIEDALLKKHKYNGLLVKDLDLLKNVGEAKISDIYPFKFKRDGDLAKGRGLIAQADLDNMLQHTEKLIENAAKRIFNGEIQLAPAEYDGNSLIQYSPYKPIMQFDPMLKENNYRKIAKLSDEEIFERVRKELENHGQSMD
ncbi:PD-(D/E)XK nuclease family protein [Fructilactobacillus frigidiflavus]|uniref:PD-(D/E)XK nuclease family protein n=1 Tax=Fructilactobacillus frigidiflavus TaxID=3242688 RepID=UPI00375702DD